MNRLTIWITTLILVVVLAPLPRVSRGEFYRYTTEEGQTVFVDDLQKVPEQYLDQIRTYRERYDHLPKEEREALLEKERAAAREAKAARKRQARIEAYRRYLESLQTPVTIRGNQVLVPVTLGYGSREVRAMLLLDTGASIIALHRDVAEMLYMPSHRKSRATMADGQVIETDMVRLDQVTVGPYRREGLIAGVLDIQSGQTPHDGLLGMNFLRGLDYRIDFDAALIRWRPQAVHQPPPGIPPEELE
jgi:predicted aspartyl protease